MEVGSLHCFDHNFPASPARDTPRCSSTTITFFWYEESSSALRWSLLVWRTKKASERLPWELREQHGFYWPNQRLHFLALQLRWRIPPEKSVLGASFQMLVDGGRKRSMYIQCNGVVIIIIPEHIDDCREVESRCSREGRCGGSIGRLMRWRDGRGWRRQTCWWSSKAQNVAN